MAEATVRTRRASFFRLKDPSIASSQCTLFFSRFADGNDERCVIRALRPLYASTSEYSVEYCCDYLSIGSTRYQGSQNAPRNVQMAAQDTIQWRSDYSVTSGGFTLCAYPNRLPDPPPSAPPSPPPPFPPFQANTMFTLVSLARPTYTHPAHFSPALSSPPFLSHDSRTPHPTSPAHPSPS